MIESIDPYTLLIYRPDAIRVWHHREIREKLRWYYLVMRDEMPAKYRIVKRVPSPINPYDESISLEELWRVHESLEREFKKIYNEIKDSKITLEELEQPEYSFLDVKIAIAKRMLKSCTICERRCGVNRIAGEKGFCQMNKDVVVHTYFLHMGEESVLVPSGTIFYGGCNFRCVFCQNWDISQENPRQGMRATPQILAKIQEELRKSGARNINHVGGDPTPHLPYILESLKYTDINVPQLWNSNMYLTIESLKLLKDVIDIWLPDFKYGNDKCAIRYSFAPRYFEIVSRNLKIVHDEGDNMIIRHLVLPNNLECCTRPILEYIAKNLPNALVNIMDQYRPEYHVASMPGKWPEISRRLKHSEIEAAFRIAREVGLNKCIEDLCFRGD